MRFAPVLILLALVTAGCLGAPASDTDSPSPHSLGGTFTEAATQDNVSAFDGKMRSFGARDVAIMESFPLQFRASRFPNGDACEGARAWAAEQPYIREVGACVSANAAAAGDDKPVWIEGNQGHPARPGDPPRPASPPRR